MATPQAKKALRKYRRENGLCIYCGDTAINGQTSCESCRAKESENRKRRAARDAARGICPNQGCSNKPTGRNKYCDACNEKSASRTHRRRRQRVNSGICGQCGKNPVCEHRTRCKDCTEKLNATIAALQQKRIAAGKCGRCGDHILVPGYKRCQPCIDEGRERHAALKLQVLEAYGGPQCVGCGESDVVVLQMDHVNGGGHQHAKQIGGRGKMYKWLRDNGFPSGFRVLCANCNIKAYRGLL